MDNVNAAAELPTVRQSFSVPVVNLDSLKANVEKLNKRARKLGLPEIQIIEGERTVKVIDQASFIQKDESGEYRTVVVPTATRTYVAVEMVGQTPRVNGWDFIATLQHLGEDGNVIRSVPGFKENLPTAFRTSKPVCNHCNTFRARKDTYVLRNTASGEFKQIGSNCLADFLRTTSPDDLAAMAEILAGAMDAAGDAEEGGGFGGGRSGGEVGFVYFMAHVVSVVRIDGAFVSAAKARIADEIGDFANATSTVSLVRKLMWERGVEADRLRRQYPVTGEDVAKAQEIIDWARANIPAMVAADETNDYIYNLSIAIKRDSLNDRLLGIAGSVIGVFNRDLAKKALAARQGDLSKSQHFGTPGERIKSLGVTLLHTHRHEGSYGTTYITKLLTDAGNVAIWFGSAPLRKTVTKPVAESAVEKGIVKEGTTMQVERLVEYGERVVIAATVKKHGERDGIKQTILSRCTVWTDEGIALEAAKLAKKAAREAKKAAKAAKAALAA